MNQGRIITEGVQVRVPLKPLGGLGKTANIHAQRRYHAKGLLGMIDRAV